MIKRLKHIVTVGMLFAGSIPAIAACPINILNPEITPRPLDYPGGTGNITFTVFEDGGVAVPAKDSFGDPTCELNVEMSYVTLKGKNITNVTGSVAQYFNITFNEAQNRVYFKQKAEIPADSILNADIAIDVTQASTSAQKFNGFQLNVYASIVEASQFTYTQNTISAPDYTPKIKLVGAVTHGTNITVPAVLTLTELVGGSNNGDVVMRIPKHAYMSFTYDSSMTTHIGKTVHNSDWEIDITRPSEYRFKYIGNNGVFPSNNVSRIGINLIIAPDTGNSGEIDFLLDIKPGNGDENQNNDQDASKIGYDN